MIQAIFRPACLLLAVMLMVLAIGPANAFYFIDTATLLLVVGLTALILLATYGWAGYGAVMRHAIGLSADLGLVRSFARTGCVISIASGALVTLIGLILMLHTLDDPATLGPGIAIACLAHVYGIVLCLLVFLPFAVDPKVPCSSSRTAAAAAVIAVLPLINIGVLLLPLVV